MKKIIKVLTALTLIFGTIFNTFSAISHAEDAEHKTLVKIHKVLLNNEDFNNFNQTNADQVEKYIGESITKLQEYFGASAKEIDGVAFRVYQEFDQAGADLKPGSDLGSDFTANKFYKEVTTDGNNVSAPFITKNGGIADVTLPNGIYVVVEDKVASPYYNTADGKELTGAKAVPFRLELPLTKTDGTDLFSETSPLHVYPKNTEDKPVVEKTFGDGTKATKSVRVGEEIPYKVTTTIPKDADYKTVKWTDEMVKGLDFKLGSLTLSTSVDTLTFTKDVDYKLTETVRGFVLELTEAGLKKLHDEVSKETSTGLTFTLNYTGVLNDAAVVDTEIPNTVHFDYGNRPGFDTTPKPVTPEEDGGEVKITVTKSFEGTWPAGVTATFDVYEQATGKFIKEFTLDANKVSETITGLDKTKQYLVIERTVTGYLPEYTTTQNGKLTVTNKKNPNPTRITPEKPHVITYGRKFVKIEQGQDATRLANAQFKVSTTVDGAVKYLALKDNQAQLLAIYNEKEAAYQAVVANAQSVTEAVTNAKVERDAAYEALQLQWALVDDINQAFVFTSDKDGKFEVTGLQEGNYNLHEIKAPAGYALLKEAIPFSVGRGTYAGLATDLEAALRVNNKKVTIPQTGGIGTVIFTVGGAAIMLFALVALRKKENKK